MTKIQYEIPEDIHRQAKIHAAELGITLKEYVVTALEEFNQQTRGKQK